MTRLSNWIGAAKRDVLALYLTARDPRVPWPAKAVAAVVVAYALSPIDLIPDFIPILGYLDDLLLVAGGVWLVLRLIPPDVMAELRATAAARLAARPTSWLGAAIVVAAWVALAGALGWWWMRP